jgi:hypothetical protein
LGEKDSANETLPSSGQGHLRDFGRLEPGLSQTETLHRLGAPDFIGGDHWEYDLYSQGASQTIRIDWDDFRGGSSSAEKKITVNDSNPRIVRVQSLEPQWRQITMRDHHVV